MKNFLILLFITIPFCGIAQNKVSENKVPEYGKVTLEELTLSSYDKDSKAEALVIYDVGLTRFEEEANELVLRFERRKKIKIFNKAGIKYAEVNIPFYREGNIFEKIEDIEAFAYNISNLGLIEKTPLDLKNVYDEKINESWSIKKFAIPGVKEGSVIEFKYALVSQALFNLQDWEFQSSIPTVFSQYETRMVPFYEYTYLLQGAANTIKRESYVATGFSRQYGPVNFNDMVYKFTAKDVPAFRDEEFISSNKDYITKIDFQLAAVTQFTGVKKEIMTTWPNMSNDLIKHPDFGKYISASENAAKKILDQSQLTEKTEREKLEYIVNLIKGSYSWNREDRIYATKSVNQFLKEKTGSSANINLFLVGLLKASGFEAEPLLISNREHGKIAIDYPFLRFFNNVVVIVKVEGKYILTDATELACPFDMIPIRCINEKGLIVKKDSNNWAELVNNTPSSIYRSFKINFNSQSDSLECIYRIKGTGYDAIKYRTTWGDKQEKVAEMLNQSGLTFRDSLTVFEYQDTKNPYQMSARVTTSSEILNNRIYVSPFLNETPSENPFKYESRTYPIDLIYSQKRTFSSEVEVPKGYKLISTPLNYKVSNDMVDIDYVVLQNEQKLLLTGTYFFKKSVYNATDYSKLKYYYNEIIRVFGDKIIFEKL